MKATDLQEAYDLTLDWVNKRRKRVGLHSLSKMPPGNCLGGSCPVFHALKDTGITWVAHAGMTREPGRRCGPFEIALPDFVQAFIVKHDSGHYPELRPW